MGPLSFLLQELLAGKTHRKLAGILECRDTTVARQRRADILDCPCETLFPLPDRLLGPQARQPEKEWRHGSTEAG